LSSPFDPCTLYIDTGSTVAQYNADNPGNRDIAFLATLPTAIWLNGPGSVGRLQDTLSQLPGTETAVFVVYYIPFRDNGGDSAGGAADFESYKDFIDSVEGLTAPFAPVFILEPDALPSIVKLNANQAQIRRECLAYAIEELNNAGTVYLDAGHPRWLTAVDAARQWKLLGTKLNRGFSLNVSNFRTDADCVGYAGELLQLTGKPSVIDTSRNGNGPYSDDYVPNPPGRKIGKLPLTLPFSSSVDGNLWIKCPGESDGPDNAGEFVPQLAVDLANG
jgi:endoglucanase